MPSDRNLRNKIIANQIGEAVGNSSNGTNLANVVDQRLYWCDVPTDTDGGVASDHFFILKTDRALKVLSVTITPQPSAGPNTLTVNATDFSTIQLLKAANATTGTNTVICQAKTVATATTNGTGNWVSGTPIAVNVLASAAELAVNDVLFISERATLNGLNTPAFRLSVLVQEI